MVLTVTIAYSFTVCPHPVVWVTKVYSHTDYRKMIPVTYTEQYTIEIAAERITWLKREIRALHLHEALVYTWG